jgi:hypothetical protein
VGVRQLAKALYNKAYTLGERATRGGDRGNFQWAGQDSNL